MCPRTDLMTRSEGHMEFELFKKIADEAAAGGTKHCYLHLFGEPLMHPQICEMIDCIASKGIFTSLSTNCTVLTEKLSRKLLQTRLHEIILSLDGMTEETYKKYRVGGNFQRVVRNVDRFLELCQEKRKKLSILDKAKKYRPWVLLQMIRMKENVNDIPALKAKYESLVSGVGEVYVKGFSTFAGFVEDFNVAPTEPIRFGCTKWKHSMTIGYDGKVTVCCRDFNDIMNLGNVKNQTIKEIWEGPGYQAFREAFRKKGWDGLDLCRNC